MCTIFDEKIFSLHSYTLYICTLISHNIRKHTFTVHVFYTQMHYTIHEQKLMLWISIIILFIFSFVLFYTRLFNVYISKISGSDSTRSKDFTQFIFYLNETEFASKINLSYSIIPASKRMISNKIWKLGPSKMGIYQSIGWIFFRLLIDGSPWCSPSLTSFLFLLLQNKQKISILCMPFEMNECHSSHLCVALHNVD